MSLFSGSNRKELRNLKYEKLGHKFEGICSRKYKSTKKYKLRVKYIIRFIPK